jgi:molybdopterin-containing oxidoreductase family membrane subunit
MAADVQVMGIFREEGQARDAVIGLRSSANWPIVRVHSPIPSHALAEAMQVRKSRAGWYTLVGGIIGFFTGFGLAIFTATRWDLIVSGKPIVALVPFVIIGFEFTILFAIFGNLIGFLHQSQLPRLQNLEVYDPRCSGDHFGVLASCAAEDLERLTTFLREKGGDVQVFAQPETRNPKRFP